MGEITTSTDRERQKVEQAREGIKGRGSRRSAPSTRKRRELRRKGFSPPIKPSIPKLTPEPTPVEPTPVEPTPIEVITTKGKLPEPPGFGEKASQAYIRWLRKNPPKTSTQVEAEKAEKAEELAKAPAPPEKGEKASPEYVRWLEKHPPTPLDVVKVFKVHPDWEVVEKDAKGNPTVYVDKAGIRWYAPGTPMYDMGYENSREYRGYRKVITDPDTGKLKAVFIGGGAVKKHPKRVAPWVTITTPEGKPAHIPKASAIELSKLRGKARFEKARELGLVPKGSHYIPGEGPGLKYLTSKEQLALQAVEKYKLPGGEYNLTSLIQSRVPRTYLYTLFGKDVVRKHAIELALPTYQRVEVKTAKAKAIEKALARGSEVAREAVIRTREKELLKTIPTTGMFAVSPALIRAKAELPTRIKELKQYFGLTPAGIELAKDAYLTEREDTGQFQFLWSKGDFKLSHLWQTPDVKLTPAQQEQIEALDDWVGKIRGLPLSQQYIEIGKMHTSVGAEAFGQIMAFALPVIRNKAQKVGQDLPPALKTAVKLLGMVAVGALVVAPLATGWVVTRVAGTPFVPNKGQYLKATGGQVYNFFRSIPATFVAKPALFGGELVGLFVVGPLGAVKIAKATGARLAPWYIPERGMGIEYSVVRIPSRLGTKQDVILAVNKGIKRALENPKGEAVVRIGDGELALKLRSTPASEVVGPALYHETPLITEALLKGEVTAKLYTSPHSAPRFAVSSAEGTPAVKPAILMIYPRKGNPVWQPTTNLYKGTKELEAIYPPYTQLNRVTNFKSRIMGPKAGEFITSHNGRVIPIYRLAEEGAVVPRLSLAELAAIRIKTIQASLADLVRGKKGYEIIKADSIEAIMARLNKNIKPEVAKGVKYETAVTLATRRELARLYESNPRGFERLYRENPNRFEQRYMANLERDFREYPGRREPLIRERAISARARLERPPIRRERTRGERERGYRRATTELRRLRTEPPRQREALVRREPVRVPPPRQREAPRRREPVRVSRIARIPERPPPPGKGGSDLEKREYIRSSLGAVTWNMGKLGRDEPQDIWHVRLQDDTHLVVRGKAPEGAKILADGPRSAYKTTQMIGSHRPTFSKIQQQHGAVRATVRPAKIPKGARISFSPGLRSVKRGQIFHTKSGGVTLLSRHPLDRRRRR